MRLSICLGIDTVTVEEDIANEIDILVQEQVSLRLKDHIPQELQEEVA